MRIKIVDNFVGHFNPHRERPSLVRRLGLCAMRTFSLVEAGEGWVGVDQVARNILIAV